MFPRCSTTLVSSGGQSQPFCGVFLANYLHVRAEQNRDIRYILWEYVLVET